MTTPSTGDAMGLPLPDEVVEAVARAMAVSIGQDPDEMVAWNGTNLFLTMVPRWKNLEVQARMHIAALEAYRKAAKAGFPDLEDALMREHQKTNWEIE